jgi:thymidylate synthase
MYLAEATLDDLLQKVICALLTNGKQIAPRRGKAVEITGALLRLTNPRARLSRTERKGHVFSCLGELLWYLAGSDSLDFIAYYVPAYKDNSDDGRKIHGAYGPRLLKMRGNNQVRNVITVLRRRPDSRRAVVQLFDSKDIASWHRDIPCTCSLQFMVRRGRLLMFTSMRSNDAYLGLPHDVFAFTMLQEIIARSLGVDVGTYTHAVGSLHLYAQHKAFAKQYLNEGWQPTVAMPPMPVGNPWPSIEKVVRSERVIRAGRAVDVSTLRLPPYWADLVRLLQVFRASKVGDVEAIERIKGHMSAALYDQYIDDRRTIAEVRAADGRRR